MPSTLSWLDFAESDRQRAMQVIDLFREKSTVDELGFAPIRDAFADYFSSRHIDHSDKGPVLPLRAVDHAAI